MGSDSQSEQLHLIAMPCVHGRMHNFGIGDQIPIAPCLPVQWQPKIMVVCLHGKLKIGFPAFSWLLAGSGTVLGLDLAPKQTLEPAGLIVNRIRTGPRLEPAPMQSWSSQWSADCHLVETALGLVQGLVWSQSFQQSAHRAGTTRAGWRSCAILTLPHIQCKVWWKPSHKNT